MKKNLRMLCLSLVAASFMTGFAQENVTSSVNNADFERGVAFWDVEFDNQNWGKNVNKSKAAGFYGFKGASLEVWNGGTLQKNSISQSLKNLPNGTYVFGAYLGAAYQKGVPGKTEEETEEQFEHRRDSIRAIMTKDSVFGVYMFANEDAIPVATDNPDRAELLRHTERFDIATKVTDGNLTIGMRVDSTNATYVCWDEVELYFFGDMAADAALNEMAKLNAQKTLDFANDSVVGKYINADTLKYLNEGLAAIQAVATPAEFAAADEQLRWGIVLATRSANDYTRLAKKIAASDALVKSKDDWYYPETVDATQAVIDYAQGLYDAKTVNRAQVNELIDTLTLSCALLQFDSLEVVLEDLNTFISDNAARFSEKEGDYSLAWKDSLERLAARVTEVIGKFSAETAIEDIELIDVVLESIEACKNAVNGSTAFQPTTLTGDPALGSESDGAYIYKSDLLTNDFRVQSIKVTFLDAYCPNGSGKGNPPFVAISEFYVYDNTGAAVALTADCFASNASDEAEGKDFGALCDEQPGTFWHSDWHGKVAENHYLEVTIPNGVELTSFHIGWRSRNANQNIPASVEVTVVVSDEEYNPHKGDLDSEVKRAESFLAGRLFGIGVGCYDADPSALELAIEEGIALLAQEEVADEAYDAQKDKIVAAMDALADVAITLPDPNKEYRLINANRTGLNVYGVEYVLTAKLDTATNTMKAQWEVAHPDSTEQLFAFEPLANDEEKLLYALKNVKTGLYVGTPTNESGEYIDDAALFETADTVTLTSVGGGKFTLDNHGLINTLGFNWGGNPKSGKICKWNDANDLGSQWYICEMNELPLTALVEGATYTSPIYYFYDVVSVVAFTADKETAFENFTLKGADGQVIEAQIDQMGSTLLVTMPEKVWAFSFSFDNKEGVTQVNVGQSKLGELREAYNEAVALNPIEGVEVGQYSDLEAYHAALETAEEYFAKGATDEQVDAAVKAINEAVAALAPNKPEADKVYYILSALEAYEENHGTSMAIYAKQTKNADGDSVSYARWTYLSTKSNYHWRFIEVETRPASSETATDTVYYNIQNVATGEYAGVVSGSTALELTDSVDNAGKYVLTAVGNAAVNINLNNNINSYEGFHTGGHSGGAGRGGNIVGWSGGLGTASSWYIVEVESVLTDLDFTVVEDDNDEEIAPIAKGIYDLYGRRVIAPTAPGIYIVDGKKKVIK